MDHWLRTIRPGRRTNSSSLDARDSGQFGTIDYQSFYRDPHASCSTLYAGGRRKEKKSRTEAGVRGVKAVGCVSTLATGCSSTFRCFLMDVSSAPRACTSIGIKWLSGFIMMGPAPELDFIEHQAQETRSQASLWFIEPSSFVNRSTWFRGLESFAPRDKSYCSSFE